MKKRDLERYENNVKAAIGKGQMNVKKQDLDRLDHKAKAKMGGMKLKKKKLLRVGLMLSTMSSSTTVKCRGM